jgi:uncharacterized protein (TIGR02996 family)
MDAIGTLLAVLQRDPAEETAWLALADCLAERGEEARSELVRLQLLLRREPDSPHAVEWERHLRRLWHEGAPPCQPLLPGPAGMVFVLIPPGGFWMGARDEEPWMDPDEAPRHLVRLTRGFYLSKYQITQRQWRAVMDVNPSYHVGDDLPVENLSHEDSLELCARLGPLLGRRARLPTEAEWEYACRAGTRTSYCSGEGKEALRLVGWCSYSGDWDGSGGTQEVGLLRSNSWGLHDMHGNVWEWCADWYDKDYYQVSPGADPPGPPDGETRVVRGGSWRGGVWFCRSAERRSIEPGVREINVGVRVVVEL